MTLYWANTCKISLLCAEIAGLATMRDAGTLTDAGLRHFEELLAIIKLRTK